MREKMALNFVLQRHTKLIIVFLLTDHLFLAMLLLHLVNATHTHTWIKASCKTLFSKPDEDDSCDKGDTCDEGSGRDDEEGTGCDEGDSCDEHNGCELEPVVVTTGELLSPSSGRGIISPSPVTTRK